jgi:nitroreductase
VLVKDEETKGKLSAVTPWASFVAKAPLIIVVCADESASREWLEDASIVGAHIYLETTNQGLGTCWVQIRDSSTPDGESSEEYVRQLLGIPSNFRVVALFPIGYPAEELSPHSDREFEQTEVHSDKW